MKTVKTRIKEIKENIILIQENDAKFEKKIISGRDWIEEQTEIIDSILKNISFIRKEQKRIFLGYEIETYISMVEETIVNKKKSLIKELGY